MNEGHESSENLPPRGLVRLALTGALVKVTGGEVTMLSQKRVRMKLELLERRQHSKVLEMVEVD